MADKFYRGAERSKQLDLLASQANKAHRAAAKEWVAVLTHAKQAGEALNEAKRILGRRGKWVRWLKDCFHGSPRTARVYMSIARHWDDDRVQEARLAGVTIDSVKAFLDCLKGKRDADNSQVPPVDPVNEMDVRRIMKELESRVRSLTADEVYLLADGRGQLIDRFWNELHTNLMHRIDYLYEDAGANVMALPIARVKVVEALNSRDEERATTDKEMSEQSQRNGYTNGRLPRGRHNRR